MKVDNVDVLDIIGECITNEYPLYLLHLPEMKLMSRGVMRTFIGSAIEEQLAAKFSGADSSETHISDVKAMVRARMHYAILSHKWLAQGEPTFQDIMTLDQTPPETPPEIPPAAPSVIPPPEPVKPTPGPFAKLKNKLRKSPAKKAANDEPVIDIAGASAAVTDCPPQTTGLSKLRAFCDKAHGSGFNWVWSDTCCIDKSSSAELEESIRSMYNWYWRSSLCMVYLADTLTLEDLVGDQWFTRGWTLQELLAPVFVKFYNRDWEPLTSNDNDKHNPGFVQRLSNITGIPVSELERYNPETNRVREKMVWASKRRTTRVEDMAYCLMGLFNVQITVAYGEGKRAFYRLQAEIMQNCNDIGVFVWSGSPSLNNSMIASGPECYTAIEMDPNDGLTRLLYAIGGEEKVQMLLAGFAPPRGDTSFRLTNRGVQMRLPLFDVESYTKSENEAAQGWNKYTLGVQGLQEIVAEVDNNSAMGVAGDWNDFKLAIIDYEAADADPNASELRTDDFAKYLTMPLPRDQGSENTLQMLLPLIRSVLPEGQSELPDFLADARKKRQYIGILLARERYQPQAFYNRIPTKDLIKIQRPDFGWNLPETVFLK
ncbi:hypothetical protein BJ138DRAFT_1126800 [Hygrophoropsis aurantiaca]|uniref:Uncharacterized protein n=1 Tax=Hygrophoropsis aurantiaca TaxID=72124 RepID=A0ACB8AB95_9AGAM|nr:hypothetical protein BJ138DRAFT_1126800 [Hygrophoropsis aurantiaca]